MIIFNFIQLAFLPLTWLLKFFKRQLIDEINKNIVREQIKLMNSRITFLEHQIQDMQMKICLQNTEQKK